MAMSTIPSNASPGPDLPDRSCRQSFFFTTTWERQDRARTALGVVGAPASTNAQAEDAARDVGTVNGYCRYDAS